MRFFCCTALFLACKNEKQEIKAKDAVSVSQKTPLSQEEQNGKELLDKCISAHGGIAKWNSFNVLEYNLSDKGKMVYQVTQLKDRRAYLKSKEYEVGFDGEVAWALPDAEKISGQSATFYYNLDFYFMGVPFLLKDPGVMANYVRETKIMDRFTKRYRLLLA